MAGPQERLELSSVDILTMHPVDVQACLVLSEASICQLHFLYWYKINCIFKLIIFYIFVGNSL